MKNLDETKRLLHQYNIRPLKRLGQSFMVDNEPLVKMCEYAELKRSDSVLEVGAGLGFLTELLADKAGKVIAIEKDTKLFEILNKRISTLENVETVHGDFLKIKTPEFNKVVSNPPYAISSSLIFKLLEKRFDSGILTFQEEFAKRLVAQKGTEEYGRLTVMVYYYSDVEMLDYVPEEAFYPSPRVSSHIMRFKPRQSPFEVLDAKLFSDVVRTLFTQRNRKVRKALKVFCREAVIPKADSKEFISTLPFLESRVEQLAPEDLGALSNAIYEKMSEK